jgi:Fe-S-cluster-containing hydrogenase component 2
MARVSLRNTYRAEELAHGPEAVVVPDQWAASGSIIYVEGSGIRVRDIDGKEYLDASSCGLCNVVGYGNKEVALKCDICYERLDSGEEPACSLACPTRCILWRDMKAISQKIERRLLQQQDQSPWAMG